MPNALNIIRQKLNIIIYYMPNGRLRGARSYTKKKSIISNNNPFNPNQLIKEGKAEGLKEGMAQGLKEGIVQGKAQGLEEGKAEEIKNTLDIKRMSAWNHLRLLMMSRQQLNILFVNLDPREAVKHAKIEIDLTNYTKRTFADKSKQDKYNAQIRKIYDIYQNIERNVLTTRDALRRLYEGNPLMSETRLIEDVSHAMENSFIIPLVDMYAINPEYIEPYLWLLFSKYPRDKRLQFSSLEDMLKEIEEDNKKFAPIIQAIDDNNIEKLNEEVDNYISSFKRPISMGPVQAGLEPLVSVQFAPAPPQPNQIRQRSTLRGRKNANAATKKTKPMGSDLNGRKTGSSKNNIIHV